MREAMVGAMEDAGLANRVALMPRGMPAFSRRAPPSPRTERQVKMLPGLLQDLLNWRLIQPVFLTELFDRHLYKTIKWRANIKRP